MSKRARITLEPEATIEPDQTTPPKQDPIPGAEQHADSANRRPSSFKANPPTIGTAGKLLSAGNLIKAALATAVVVAVVVFLKARKP